MHRVGASCAALLGWGPPRHWADPSLRANLPWGYGGWVWERHVANALYAHIERVHTRSVRAASAATFARHGRCFIAVLYWMFVRGPPVGTAPPPSGSHHRGIRSKYDSTSWLRATVGAAPPPESQYTFYDAETVARAYLPPPPKRGDDPSTMLRTAGLPNEEGTHLEMLGHLVMSPDRAVLRGLFHLISALNLSFVRLPFARSVYAPDALRCHKGKWVCTHVERARFEANTREMMRVCPSVRFFVFVPLAPEFRTSLEVESSRCPWPRPTLSGGATFTA